MFLNGKKITQVWAANVSEMSSSNGTTNGATTNGAAEESTPVVRLRNKPPLAPTQAQATKNGKPNGDHATLTVLQRGLEALNEVSPEVDESAEEIRKLDSQLDHLNTYMGKVEEKIKAHNEKLMDTLKHQKEEREKRRRSFHERLQQSQQEDDDFQTQMASILRRVDVSKNRASVYDMIKTMEVPKVEEESAK